MQNFLPTPFPPYTQATAAKNITSPIAIFDPCTHEKKFFPPSTKKAVPMCAALACAICALIPSVMEVMKFWLWLLLSDSRMLSWCASYSSRLGNIFSASWSKFGSGRRQFPYQHLSMPSVVFCAAHRGTGPMRVQWDRTAPRMPWKMTETENWNLRSWVRSHTCRRTPPGCQAFVGDAERAQDAVSSPIHPKETVKFSSRSTGLPEEFKT